MHGEQYKKLIIRDIVDETNEVRLFYFEESSTHNILYKAGQYLTFLFEQGGKESRRSYSLASSPVINEPLYIGIKRIPNGSFSRKLFDQAKPGDVLLTAGVGGVFILPDDVQRYRQFFFFAAGSGIIPIYSLIKTLLYLHTFISIVLVYSNRSQAKAVFYDELDNLQASYPERLHIEFLFSNTEDLFRARLHADLVALYLDTLAIDKLDNCLYYTCGPEAYMRFCMIVLQGYNIPPQNIKKEIFHTSRPVVRIEPPDQAAYNVFIMKGQVEYEVKVQYPTTILQAAKTQEIDMPYSCEVGKCGNCMAICMQGKVWMSYNEVLTERELAKGFVLTCTGFPV
ncbi:MAG TPA: ferredoxin--NADP reductase, partial [Flavitalea sp.]|nr:ferredoxin--NADP reductase [Flavitalea sp.]